MKLRMIFSENGIGVHMIFTRGLELQDFIVTITSGSTVAFIVVTNVANLASPNLWKRLSASFYFFSAFSVNQ